MPTLAHVKDVSTARSGAAGLENVLCVRRTGYDGRRAVAISAVEGIGKIVADSGPRAISSGIADNCGALLRVQPAPVRCELEQGRSTFARSSDIEPELVRDRGDIRIREAGGDDGHGEAGRDRQARRVPCRAWA